MVAGSHPLNDFFTIGSQRHYSVAAKLGPLLQGMNNAVYLGATALFAFTDHCLVCGLPVDTVRFADQPSE
jgi:hypothetical protein